MRNYDKPADEHLPVGQVGTNVDKYGKVSSQGFPWRPIVATLIFNCVRDPLSACGLVGQFCRAKPVHFWQAAKRLLARDVALLASSLDSLQGTSEKIHLHRFVRQ